MPIGLLHVARLTVALELRIEIGIARALGIPAGQPLGIGPFDGKAPHPLAQRILDGQRVGHVMTGTTEFGALEHHVVIALVDQKIALLVGHIPLEDRADIGIGRRTVVGVRQRPKPFGHAEGVWGEAIRAGPHAPAQVGLGRVRDVERILVGGSYQVLTGLHALGWDILRSRFLKVVIRGVTTLDIRVADFADNAGLATLCIAEEGLDGGKGHPRTVVRGGIEGRPDKPVFEPRGRIAVHIGHGYLVHIIGRHMAPRTEVVQQRPSIGRRLGRGPQVEGRGTVRIGKRIEVRLGRAVRGRGDRAVAVGGGHAAEQEEGAPPAGVTPGIGHHGPIPLLEDLRVAPSAEHRIIDGGPFVFIGWRVGLGLGDIVRCGFRDAIGQLAMAGVPRRSPEHHKSDGRDQRSHPAIHAHATPLSLSVPCLSNVDFSVRRQKKASPCRDAIVKALARRHTKRVSFGQGPMTSVRVERWGSRNRNYRYWAGLLRRYLLRRLSFFCPRCTPPVVRGPGTATLYGLSPKLLLK